MSTVKNIIISSLVSAVFVAGIACANTTTTTTEQAVKHTKKTHSHHHAVKSRHHEHHAKSDSKSKSEDLTKGTAPVPGNAQSTAAKAADDNLTNSAQSK